MSAATVALAERLRRWRHDLHQIPETGFAEHRRGDYLAAELSAMGLKVTRGIGGTGLVATVPGSASDGPGLDATATVSDDQATLAARGTLVLVATEGESANPVA